VTTWREVFDAIGEPRFVEMREALVPGDAGLFDRDRFLLNGAVAAVLRDLVPDDAPTDTLTTYGTLLHFLYIGWHRGWPGGEVDAARLRYQLGGTAPVRPPADGHAFGTYRLPPRLVWGRPDPDGAAEPVDVVFVSAGPERLRALALLGARDGRDGFSTLEADVPLPVAWPGPRDDGSQAFASVLPGGDRAGLISLTTTDELAYLAGALGSRVVEAE